MTDSPTGLDHIDDQNLVDFLGKTRWFGGKGRPFAVSAKRRIGDLGDTGPFPRVVVLLVELTYSDVAPDAPDAVELYQVPLSLYRDAEHRLDHAFIGWWEEPDLGWVHAYDAVHDRAAMARYLDAFGRARLAQEPTPAADTSTHSSVARVGGMDFHRLAGHELELDATPSLFSGEQSNSSVYFGEDAVLKLFRKVTPGANPDITTHEALTRAGSPQVAHLYGWIQLDEPASEPSAGPERPSSSDHPAQTLHLGMLQQFLRTATDGWDLALHSVRNLYADPDLAARDAGGDFAGESARLGEALREVHDVLRDELPTLPATAPTPAQISAAMSSRLDAALDVVPGLAEHAQRLRRAYAAVADLPEVAVQTVHGDLHLGQTLRTALGWKIVDFEGEPARPLAERMLPDSPWRDVAGMLRSFDYAPHVVERTHAELEDEGEVALHTRGAGWAERNKRHFLAAYAGGDLTAEQRTLLDAYVADKAVYETVYETRNRPTWVEIPLAAVATIGAP